MSGRLRQFNGNAAGPVISRAQKSPVTSWADLNLESFQVSNLILHSNSKVVTMSSREIAELVESNHADVKRSIDRLCVKRVIDIPPLAEYLDALGRGGQFEFLLDKRSSYIVVAQLSPEFTARLVDRWQELENDKAGAVLSSEESKLLLIQELATKQLALIHENKLIAIERDHAIATKAQIGEKKVATAMATASAKSREASKLKDLLGFNTRNATVIAVEGASGKKFGKQDWRPLKAWCQGNGASSITVPCVRYGKAQAWPAGAWGAVYGVDLVELFGGAV